MHITHTYRIGVKKMIWNQNNFAIKLPIDPTDTYILTDFDRTLTLGSSMTSWSVLSKSPDVSKEYIDERNALYEIYRPIEVDETMDFAKRSAKMCEWWQRHIELFQKYALKESVILKAAQDIQVMAFRPGAEEFLKYTYQHQIPVIIISAGIGNFIQLFLESKGVMYPNIHIVSNFILFTNGVATGVGKNIIHSLNKNEVSLDSQILSEINGRNTEVIMGDLLADLKMADENNGKRKIKVGFLEPENENLEEQYKEAFDIIMKEESFTTLQQLFNWTDSTKRSYKEVHVSKKGEQHLLSGHPWTYESDITATSPMILNGELVDIKSPKGKYLGTGFYNANSKIRVRLLSRNSNDKFDVDFFARRVRYAYEYRKSVFTKLPDAYRLIFGESDGLPGLTVDVFHDIIVTQTLCLGTELRKKMIFDAILKILQEDGNQIRGIFERNDVKIREKEGLEENKGWYFGSEKEPTTVSIEENGIHYFVDFAEGQKTGFFLDQKENRMRIRSLSHGKTVLDCCTHTGSFAMNAMLGGCKKVTALDISSSALETAQKNFALNQMKIDTICEDCFTYLESLASSKQKPYDFIILDPPAFTKSHSTIHNALKGYCELNYLAMKALPRGGFLATASCSALATEEAYKKAIYEASIKAGVTLKQVSASGPSPDHPETIGIPETKYLKFFIFQII